MKQHPHLVHPRQQQQIYGGQQQQQQSGMSQYHQMDGGAGQQTGKTHKRIGAPYLTQQRSFSSSEEDLRSTSDFDGE